MVNYTGSKKDNEIFSQVVNGQFTTKNDQDAVYKGCCDEWTQDALEEYFAPKMVTAFFENLPQFQKKAQVWDVSKIALVALTEEDNYAIYAQNKRGLWKTKADVLDKVIYDQTGDVANNKTKFLEYVRFNDHSNVQRFGNFYTRYLIVGNRFFDVEAGEMVESAPEELRIFGINRNVDFVPTHVDECDGFLMSSMRWSLGDGALEYLIRCVAHNLYTLNMGGRHMVIIAGRSRSGKGTFLKALTTIGLTNDQKSVTPDLESTTEYKELSAEVMPCYPVAVANELCKLDWSYVKKLCSDDGMSVNRKFEKHLSFANRAFVIATANRLTPSSEAGIRNKITILTTKNSFMETENKNFWTEIEEKDGYDEFINCILTYAYEIRNSDWTPKDLPESIAEETNRLTDEYLYLDHFTNTWDKTAADITLVEAYRRMLKFANPEMLTSIVLNTAVQKATTFELAKAPKNINGISYSSFKKVLLNYGISTYRKSGVTWVQGSFTNIEPELDIKLSTEPVQPTKGVMEYNDGV